MSNYLNDRFCAGRRDSTPPGAAGAPPGVGAIVRFDDERFSHLVLFAGFIAIDTSLVLAQAAHPRRGFAGRRRRRGRSWNLRERGVAAHPLDLPVTGAVAVVALLSWPRARWRRAEAPVAEYIAYAYLMGSAAVLAATWVR